MSNVCVGQTWLIKLTHDSEMVMTVLAVNNGYSARFLVIENIGPFAKRWRVGGVYDLSSAIVVDRGSLLS